MPLSQVATKFMLAQVMPENGRSTHAETRRKALEHTDALIDIAGRLAIGGSRL